MLSDLELEHVAQMQCNLELLAVLLLDPLHVTPKVGVKRTQIEAKSVAET